MRARGVTLPLIWLAKRITISGGRSPSTSSTMDTAMPTMGGLRSMSSIRWARPPPFPGRLPARSMSTTARDWVKMVLDR